MLRFSHLIRAFLSLAISLTFLHAEESKIPDDTPVFWSGEGKRVHVEGCPRFKSQPEEARAKMQKMTAGEARAKGLPPCSRCPGSALNQERIADAEKQKQQKQEKAAENPKPSTKPNDSPGVEYDPNLKVYVDALWYRVHTPDCPAVLLKEHKKTITLAEADKLGYRLGEDGQSGRSHCCLVGYKRQHPKKTLPDDALLAGSDNPKHGRSYPGCHRRQMNGSFTRKTKKEWEEGDFVICGHCKERGPSDATISEANWAKMDKIAPYTAPEGWTHKPYAFDRKPSKEEIEILIQETLAGGSNIQELPFDNPVAGVEQFMFMRFFFPVSGWLQKYQVYRATGDERVFDLMLVSARHYHKLAKNYLPAAQQKASDPEGLPFIYTMAMCSRITLQKARKDPKSISQEQLDEAEDFLKTMVSVLEPTWGSSENLDPEMGIHQSLAEDFRYRAYNRSMNGIGTLATVAVTLEDLQKLKGHKEHQAAIDRYRKAVSEYIKYWFSRSYFCDKTPGVDGAKGKGFYYSYAPREGEPQVEDGAKFFKRHEDRGHYSHTLQGLTLIYEAMPEVGIDDDFMTAVANAIHFSSVTPVTKGKIQGLSGYVQCPTVLAKRPKISKKGHTYSPGQSRFYLLQAFRPDMIESLSVKWDDKRRAEHHTEFENRVKILHAQYMQAFRKDRSLIHLPK